MRETNDSSKNLAEYVENYGSNVMIRCSKCHSDSLTESVNDLPHICACGKELFYPAWCEW